LLIAISIILIIAAIFLSYHRSNFLTKDIKALNKKIALFIKADFKENDEVNPDFVRSRITEIDQLNRSYMLLKRTLKASLTTLENSVVEEKKASEYKSSFVANISHEIRTPLTGIIGMVHILKGTHLSKDQAEMLETLDFSANHLRELINMVLDYSKIEAGKMELESIPFDLQGDITKMVKLFDYKILEKGLQLNVEYTGNNASYVIGDPLRLQQVLMNLLNNAIKFTSVGKINLRISPIATTADSQLLRFEVEDSGIGIDVHEIDKLFVAFNQANKTISRNFGGTGLGLTISNQLIKLMGGQLNVKSVKHQGSVFSFELQFKTGEPIKTRKKDQERSMDFFEPMNILLAEDNFINQKVVARMLQKYNATITFANNGLEAVELYQNNNYDLIFMDIQMPEMDGFEATAVITQSERYLYNNPPIVAFSANAYSTDRKKAEEAGMDDFLSKPIKPDDLYGIMAKYMLQKEVLM
jgi:signal transduction histidine kinase/CheY-like chemotaxis protein